MEERLDMQSPNWVHKNSAFIAQYFPNCVTETAKGIKIDFEILQQELRSDLIQGNKERYRLEWPGKREAIVTANLPTTKTLRPVREDSVDFDNTENVYIEGDNLEVLKLLQESYLGKIKMIYIDPPYNTGKDFVYKDNFTKDSQDELIESGQKDEYNQRLVVNPETAGRYHSDWLTMMYPRLKLARNLLTNDGVIFISIDENEIANLKKVGEEIFGASNFYCSFIWQRRSGAMDSVDGTSIDHEYILCFAKNKVRLKGKERQFEKYANPDNDPRGPWVSDNLSAGKAGGEVYYEIEDPETGNKFLPPKGRYWPYSPATMKKKIEEGRVIFPKTAEGRPMLKRFKNEAKSIYVPVSSIMRNANDKNIPTSSLKYALNTTGTKEVQELFTTKVFSFPKPTLLIQELISQIDTDKKDFIVLDFFSGSASSAHAILKTNAEQGMNIKFIQVQISEQIEENTESFKAGYHDICEIGKERIRRAAKKIKKETNADIDYGFRVYRLDSSNMQDVYYKPQDYDQANLDLFGDNVKPDRTADDLLAQVMLDWGLPLSLKIEQADVSGKNVFKVAENSLYACFDNGIDEDFAKEIAKDKPLRIVFKDSGFKNDTAKTNVKQLLKQLSPETEMKVI